MRRRRTLICGGTCGNDVVSWYLHEFPLRLKAERGMRACCLVVLLPYHPAGAKWLRRLDSSALLSPTPPAIPMAPPVAIEDCLNLIEHLAQDDRRPPRGSALDPKSRHLCWLWEPSFCNTSRRRLRRVKLRAAPLANERD
jgi:hypothetical protein